MNLKNLFSKDRMQNKDLEKEIKETWDKHGRVGYEHFAEMKVAKEYMSALERMLLPCPGGVVLDAGCGVGHNFERILSRTQAQKLVGGDYSDEMLKRAKKFIKGMDNHLQDKIELKKFDLTKEFPFPDKTFDAVVFNLSLNYLPSYKWRNCLKGTFRTLKPNGRVYFVGQTREFDFSKGYKGEVFKELKEKLLKGKISFVIWLLRVKSVISKLNELQKREVIIYPSIDELVECLEGLEFRNIEVISQPNAKEYKGGGVSIRAQKP